MCIPPSIDSIALPVEVEHAFETGRQAVINQPTIFVQERINLVAQRLGQSVKCGTVLHEHTDFLNYFLFDPANFLNEHYLNAAGVTINATVWPANAALDHHRCPKPMLAASSAAQTRTNGVHFLTVDTTIQKT